MRSLASGIVLGFLVTFDGFMFPNAGTSTVSEAVAAVAVSDVFNDFPSGLRVESGDSLDLLSTIESIDTSSTEKGAAVPHANSLLPIGWSAKSPLTGAPGS